MVKATISKNLAKAPLHVLPIFIFIFFGNTLWAQTLHDGFEGQGNINSWHGDDCGFQVIANPVAGGINNSANVAEYHDAGGTYANVRFDAGRKLNLAASHVFSFKIYVPSSGLTGNQTNQVSLKLQDATLGSPWSTQSEIIKPITLNQWQVVTFDFANDPYSNLDPSSLPPTSRSDFDRILIQVNGENNNDEVIAYIDDFLYVDTAQAPPAPVFNNLVWADEFTGTGAIDTSKWFHQTQLPSGGSWYNGEIQHYTDRTANASVAIGQLNLIAKKEQYTNQGHTKQYTSARLNSKFAFKYGRVEVRAKLPRGAGTWPAIWMLGKNINETGAYWETQGFGTTGWPACGEIDIMEHWGTNQNYVSSATHTPSSFGGTINHGGQTISTVSSQFHIYALEWTADKLVFSVDSVVHFVYQPTLKDASTWPFDAPQYILLNIAIEPGIVASFIEDTMEIDYVRVYKQSGVSMMENKQEPKVTFHPNPVQNELHLHLGLSGTQTYQVQILNALGKVEKQMEAYSQNEALTITGLGDLAPGLYFLAYRSPHQKGSFKFIKQ